MDQHWHEPAFTHYFEFSANEISDSSLQSIAYILQLTRQALGYLIACILVCCLR